MVMKAEYNMSFYEVPDVESNNVRVVPKRLFRVRSSKNGSDEKAILDQLEPVFRFFDVIDAICEARHKLYLETNGARGYSERDVIRIMTKNDYPLERTLEVIKTAKAKMKKYD